MGAKLRHSKAFTLVEVTVLTMVVGLAVAGLLTSFVMGRIHTAVARHRIQAANLLRARIEELKSKGYDYLNAFDPNPSIEERVVLDAGRDELSPHDDLTCIRSTRITDSDGDGVLEITVGVQWRERVASRYQMFSEKLFTIVAPTDPRDG